MLSNIKQFFEQNFVPASSGLLNRDSDKAGNEQATRLAMAALLVEVAESDYRDKPEEHEALLTIIRTSFELTDDEAQEIIELARKEHADSTDYFQFTRLINDSYSAQQKIELIEKLWEVAFSDKHLDKYEEHVIRRIADLIYVSHSDFIASKERVRNKS